MNLNRIDTTITTIIGDPAITIISTTITTTTTINATYFYPPPNPKTLTPGLPAYLFTPWVEQLRYLDCTPAPSGPPTVRTLDAEMEPLLLSKAR